MREVVGRARQGDSAALRALYEEHVERVYRLAFRMTGDDEFARDATQDTFVRAFQRLEQFRGDAAFSTWLHTIAVSVVLNGLRRLNGRRRREVAIEATLLPDTCVKGNGFELRERIRAAVDSLPDLYRTVFVMYDVEGYSHPEISRALGVPEGTSKARLSRARARLRVLLSEFRVGNGRPSAQALSEPREGDCTT